MSRLKRKVSRYKEIKFNVLHFDCPIILMLIISGRDTTKWSEKLFKVILVEIRNMTNLMP